MWHPCPECAKCLTPGRLYDPTACAPCQTFLADMQQDPSASSLASKTWMKWNRTLVNRWKKNNVALYSPANVRMLIWADSTLFHSYEAVLPPTPPPRSSSRDSLSSVDRPEASPIPPVDPLLDQDRSSPWSGFEEVLPPNQEARPRSPTVPHAEPTLPLSPSVPPSHRSQSQPPSDPMMAMFRSMMSSFQSELKTLRSDLSGSMSTMVAEAVAAHLPQVPYQTQNFSCIHCSYTKIVIFTLVYSFHVLFDYYSPCLYASRDLYNTCYTRIYSYPFQRLSSKYCSCVRWYVIIFHLLLSVGGQEGCRKCDGAGSSQKKGPTSLSTQPVVPQTALTGRSPTTGRPSGYVLGMHFYRVIPCQLSSCTSIHSFAIEYN